MGGFVRFKGLDLNLLQALDVLLEERHVSRAAERLHITQPAMSGALTRLRQYFDDPLLVQHGKRMIPTSHALSLGPRLKRVLGEIDALVSQLGSFDPSLSDRNFRVIASDYVVAVLFSPLARILANQAPNISIEFLNPSERTAEQFEQGEIDLLITPEYIMHTRHEVTHLYDEDQVVVGWAENPVMAAGRMSEDAFFTSGHVIVELGRLRRHSYVESHLSKHERKRRVSMRVSSFLAAPELVVGTNLITVTHRSLANLYMGRLDVAIASLPFEIPPMRQLIACHEARTEDPGVLWLRRYIDLSVSIIRGESSI